MTALPPDLREAVETVRCNGKARIAKALRDGRPAIPKEEVEQAAALALIEQRLMEYERVAEAARTDLRDGGRANAMALATALAAFDSQKETS